MVFPRCFSNLRWPAWSAAALLLLCALISAAGCAKREPQALPEQMAGDATEVALEPVYEVDEMGLEPSDEVPAEVELPAPEPIPGRDLGDLEGEVHVSSVEVGDSVPRLAEYTLSGAEDDLPRAAPLPPLVSRSGRSVDLFYGTSRARGKACRGLLGVESSAEAGCVPARFYGGEPGPLEVGRLRVTFPMDHDPSRIERPFEILSVRFRSEDPNRDVVLAEIKTYGGDLDAWAEEVRRTGRTQALLYVHGFATTFEEAAWRAAQIAYDIDFRGLPLLYSWPSRGGTLDYVRDYDVVQLGIEPFQRFLRVVAERTGVEEVHVVSHSMGNQLVAYALREMAITGERHAALEKAQLVLAAPDIDAEVFRRRFVEHLPKLFGGVTLYVSSKDRALEKAREVRRQRPRAGEPTGWLHQARLPRIEIVDASGLETDFLSHSYYANNDSVRADMFCLLAAGLGAADRPLLELEGPFWRFKPPEVRRALRADDCGVKAVSAGPGPTFDEAAASGEAHAALGQGDEPGPVSLGVAIFSGLVLAILLALAIWTVRRRRSSVQ